MKIASLTCKDVNPNTTIDDHFAFKLLEESNIKVTQVLWDSDEDWKQFDLVIIRTTWDYTERLSEFLNVLHKISLETKLINSYDLIKWNANKRYLIELEKLGIKIIPTLFRSEISINEIKSLLNKIEFQDGLVIKPCVGASSKNIQFIKSIDEFSSVPPSEWFIQPIQKMIQINGEFSLFFFDGKYSHAINKLPKSGDYRCQEEYGSKITDWTPNESTIQMGHEILNKLPEIPSYARVDLLQNNSFEFQLIELELIEPCLYIGFNPNAPKNLASMIKRALEH